MGGWVGGEEQSYHPSRVFTLIYQPIGLVTSLIFTWYEARCSTRLRVLAGFSLFFTMILLLIVVSLNIIIWFPYFFTHFSCFHPSLWWTEFSCAAWHFKKKDKKRDFEDCSSRLIRGISRVATDFLQIWFFDCNFTAVQVDLATSGQGSVGAYVAVCFLIAGCAIADGTSQGGILGDLSLMEPAYIQVWNMYSLSLAAEVLVQ